MAKRRSKRTAKQAPQRRAASNDLSGMSMAELVAEVRRREKQVSRLQSRRERLIEELAQIDAELSGSAGVARGGGRRGGPRANNKMTLEDALVNVLQGRTMGVSEAADAVRSAGYHSSAANFRTMVNQTLLRSERIKKVARGQYTAA